MAIWAYSFKRELDIIKRIRLGIRKRKKTGAYSDTKKGYINHRLENSIINAVDFIGLKDIHNERHFHKPTEFKFKGWKDLGLNLSREDNNNGFFICEITKDLKLKYGFISGFEDENPIKIKHTKQYLNLFYSDTEINKNKKYKKYINKLLEGFLKFEGLNLYDLKETTKEINKNKPSWLEAVV